MKNQTESELSQLRLFLEEVCCDICRFEHASRGGLAPDNIQIAREFYLGEPGAFADIRVSPAGAPAYFVEIKFGYPADRLQAHLRRKYGNPKLNLGDVSSLVVVVQGDSEADRKALEADLSRCIRPGLKIEIWDEARVATFLHKHFGVKNVSLMTADMREIRELIDRAKGFNAFGGESLEAFRNDPLTSELLWHFGVWRLQEFRTLQGLVPTSILPPGLYRNVAILVADLCSFSSHVRDTRDNELIRHCLTSFYSKARYEVINKGAMLYQVVGDSVIGAFGIPDQKPAFTQDALLAGKRLISIGLSVSHHWQRHLDRAQPATGLRVGIAIGDLQVVSLRPFSRTRIGFIGDAINLAARLQTAAKPNEIVVSNTFYNQLEADSQSELIEMEPMEARNVGNIKAWRTEAQLRG